MAENRIVALCADDYSLSYGVSAGILEAVDAGRITAVSALVNGPRWPAMGLELCRRGRNADVGLHFNLTLGRPLSSMPKFAPNGEFPPLSNVIRMAYGRRLPMEEIRAEIDRQLDRFEAVMDRPPDHVDGHQHVHQLPVVRDMLIAIITRRYASNPPWLRRTQGLAATSTPLRHRFKSAVISGLGCGRLAALADQHHIEMNRRMMGVYDFAGSGMAYADLMQGWLVRVREGDLIMTHPADKIIYNDPIAAMRTEEYQYLSGNEFGDLLAHRRIVIATMSSILHGSAER